MKRLITILLLAFAFTSHAQDDTTKYIHYPYTYGTWYPRGMFDKVLRPPNDTIYSKNGIAIKAGLFYFGNGVYWSAPSGGSATDTSSLSNRINTKLNISDTAGMLGGYSRVNRLKDTAAAIRASIPGAATIQSASDNGPSSTKGIVLGQKDSIGYIFKYLMGTNPIDPTIGKTGTATLAVDGSKMLIVGGARNLNNFLDFPLKFGWWNFTIKFKTVVHHKSGTSGGVGVAIVAAGAGTSVMWSFMQHDTAAYVNYSPAVQLPQLTDENNKGLVDWRWNNYDTVEYIIQRRGRSFTAEMRDVGTGITSRFHEDDRMFNAVGNLRLYLYNDSTWFVDSLKIRADEPKNPVAFYIGDSWVYGGDASTEANSHVVKSSSGYTAIYSGGPSEQSLQGTYRFGDLVAAAPQIAFWEDNVNDINSSGGGPGVALDSFCKRTIRFIQLCQSIGTVPILATPGPQVADGTKWKDSINVIGARFNVRVMPVFETLKDTLQTYLAAKYVGNSSIHPNDAGHDKYAELERFEIQRLGYSKAPTIQWPSIPRSSYFKYELGLNGDNQPVAMPARTNPNYLWAINGTINNLTVPQVGSGSYAGNWWWACNPDFRISPIGTSMASAPYLLIDINGVQPRILSAGLGGLVVNTTSTTFNTNDITISAGVKIKPANTPLIVLENGLGTSKNIMSLNSLVSTWSITDTLFAKHRNDTLKGYTDAFGGDHANWKSGYMHPMDYTGLGANDWVTKTHLDSIAAALAAGTGSITGVTDGHGFDLTAASSNISVKLQYTKGQMLYARNDSSIVGNDSATNSSGQIFLNYYHTTLPQLRIGDIGFTAFSLNNYWIGPIKYNSGFKYITSGSYAPHIYFNAGSIDMNVTASTGSADAAATVLTAFHIDKTGKLGDAGVASPNSWHQLSAGTTALAPLTFQAGTNLTTPITGAVEYDGTNFFGTNSTPTRQVVITASTATPLTSGTTPVATTGGKLTDGLILAGSEYTPTLANVTNAASTTSGIVNYTRVGSYVHVQGSIGATATAPATFTTISITLPIASAMTLATDLSGSGTSRTSAALNAAVVDADTSADVANVSFYSGTGGHTIYFSFMYKIK